MLAGDDGWGEGAEGPPLKSLRRDDALKQLAEPTVEPGPQSVDLSNENIERLPDARFRVRANPSPVFIYNYSS